MACPRTTWASRHRSGSMQAKCRGTVLGAGESWRSIACTEALQPLEIGMVRIALVLSILLFLILKNKSRPGAGDTTPSTLISTASEEAEVRGAEAAAAEYKRLAG